jgi:hypothetical protein
MRRRAPLRPAADSAAYRPPWMTASSYSALSTSYHPTRTRGNRVFPSPSRRTLGGGGWSTEGGGDGVGGQCPPSPRDRTTLPQLSNQIPWIALGPHILVSITQASDLRIIFILNLTWSDKCWHASVEQIPKFPHILAHPANSVYALTLIVGW